MLQFQMPNITREQLAGNRARFEVEPLDRGFGHTFGNALRRVLLSSLEGAAVSSVKIEGVAHEFTTIKGVKEDVTDIILNLKELVCRLHGELDEVQVRLYKDKPGKVVGGRHRHPGRARDPQPGSPHRHAVGRRRASR